MYVLLGIEADREGAFPFEVSYVAAVLHHAFLYVKTLYLGNTKELSSNTLIHATYLDAVELGMLGS